MDTTFIYDEDFTSLPPEQQKQRYFDRVYPQALMDERFTALSPEDQQGVIERMWADRPVIPEEPAPDRGWFGELFQGLKGGGHIAAVSLADIFRDRVPFEDPEFTKEQLERFKEIEKQTSPEDRASAVYQAGTSIPTSLMVMLPGVVAGYGISTLATAGGLGPASLGIGAVTSGAVSAPMMYKIGYHQMMRQVRDTIKEKYEMIPEQWEQVQASIEEEAKKAGLFEAGGEFVSDALGYLIFKAPVAGLGKSISGLIGKKAADKLVKNFLGRAGVKYAGMATAEIGGEAITQEGQKQALVEAERKLEDKVKLAPEGYDPSAPLLSRAAEAVEEVWKPTAIQTGLLGAGRYVTDIGLRGVEGRLRGEREAPAPTPPVAPPPAREPTREIIDRTYPDTELAEHPPKRLSEAETVGEMTDVFEDSVKSTPVAPPTPTLVAPPPPRETVKPELTKREAPKPKPKAKPKPKPERIFQTEKGARSSMRQRKLEDHTVVPVKGGFKIVKGESVVPQAKPVAKPKKVPVVKEVAKEKKLDEEYKKLQAQKTIKPIKTEEDAKLQQAAKEVAEKQAAQEVAETQTIETAGKIAKEAPKGKPYKAIKTAIIDGAEYEFRITEHDDPKKPELTHRAEMRRKGTDEKWVVAEDVEPGTSKGFALRNLNQGIKALSEVAKIPEKKAPKPLNLDRIFRTKRGAESSIRQRKIEGHEPVEVEGGFKITPVPKKKKKPTPTVKKEKYAVTERPGRITKEDVQKAVGKGLTVTQVKDDAYEVSGQDAIRPLRVEVVEHIPIDKATFEKSYGRKPTDVELKRGASGIYRDSTIQISSTGDKYTVTHELVHGLVEGGVLSVDDARAIIRSAGGDDSKLTADNITDYEEQIAAHIEGVRMERDKPKGKAKEIIQRVIDFLDGVVNLFRRTALGVVRDIESGKVFKRTEIATPTRPIIAYSVSERQDAENTLTGDAINFIKNIGSAIGPAKLTKKRKTDLSYFWDLILQTPSFFAKKIYATKRIYHYAQQRMQIFHNTLFNMETYEIKGLGSESFSESYMSVTDIFKRVKKEGKKKYSEIMDYLVDTDRYRDGYKIKFDGKNWIVRDRHDKSKASFKSVIDEHYTDKGEEEANTFMIDEEAKVLQDKGFSDAQIIAVKAFRTSTSKGFNILTQNLRKLEALYTKQGKESPKVKTFDENGKVIEVSIQEAISKMGDLRGTYFPRIRKPGRFILTARKEGADNELELFNVGTLMNLRATELRQQGYTVETDEVDKVGEDVFQMGGELVKTQQILDAAIERVERKDLSSDDARKATLNMVTTAITEQVAEVIRERGARVFMNKRSEIYWKGFETDPMVAIAKYMRGISAGEAKRQMTSGMMKALTGTEIRWGEYKKIAEYESDFESLVSPEGEDFKEFDDIEVVTKEIFEEINDPEGIRQLNDSIKDLKAMIKDATGEEKARLEEDLSAKEAGYYGRYRDFVKDKMIDQKTQKTAFRWAKEFIGENTRNQEAADRVIGVFRGLAVAKYLAFRWAAAPLINLSALPTTTIATMKAAGIPYFRTYDLITRSIIGYGKYKTGKLTGDLVKVFDHITHNGWDNPQFTSEAMSVLRSVAGRAFDKAIEVGMVTFAMSERLNRAATIAATYQGLKQTQKGKSFEELMEAAKEVSDYAHGEYGRSNAPYLALGRHPAAHVARMFYVFRTFSHTSLQNMARIGFKDPVALSHMLFAPAVLAGAGASVVSPVLSAIFKQFGADEPEEQVYRKVGEVFGPSVESYARFGLGGKVGVSLKGSLRIGITDVPTNLKEVIGAPGSVIGDLYDAIVYFRRDDYWKSLEKTAPTGIGNILRARREYEEGLTTRTSAPLFYGAEQVRPTFAEAFWRGMSFNPVRIAEIREIQAKEYDIKKRYRQRSNDIYAKLKKYILDGSDDEYLLAEIIGEIYRYNEDALRWGLSPITKKTIKRTLTRSFKPSKFERSRD